MPSKIDASKPADVVAAVKADLRTNLAHAKTELEHMGFYDPAKNITGRQRSTSCWPCSPSCRR